MDKWKKKITFETESHFKLTVSRLEIYISRNKNSWWISYDEGEADDVLFKIEPLEQLKILSTEKERERWILDPKTNSLYFSLVTPDKPLVIRPEFPVRIQEKKSAQFYVGIPLWLRAETSSGVILFEKPLHKLSNTWFGEINAGENCYSFKSKLLHDPALLDQKPGMGVCPLMIINNSKNVLYFQKVCLHVEYLSLYAGPIRLWSNPVNITFQGEEQLSQIQFLKKAPSEREHSQKVFESREKIESLLVKKSFKFLKEMSFF